MKLKHPVVFSLTSICHCNLERENGRETDGKKNKGKAREMVPNERGEIRPDPSGQEGREDGEQRR